MFESSDMLFVTVFGKADALGGLDDDERSDQDLCRRRTRCGLRGGYGCRRGYGRSSAIYGRDDRRACRRRIYNQFANQPHVDRLSLWADAGLSIGLRGARRDAWCRRFFVWLLIVWAGESFRSRTLMIKTDRLGSYRSRIGDGAQSRAAAGDAERPDRSPFETTSLLAGTTRRRRKIGTRRHTRSLHGPLAAWGL